MSPLTWLHIGAGCVALVAGTAAAAARKGGRLHANAGLCFVASMMVLGLSASILAILIERPGQWAAGFFVGYFVLTSWLAARRRDGTGWFEKIACAVMLVAGLLVLWDAFNGATTPAGRVPFFVFAGICLLAGLLDLKAILRGLTPAQRISRHLWRMCVAFFIATGSFFIGQQDVMPEAVRGSPMLLALGFAPFAIMVFWLVRLRFAGPVRRIIERMKAPSEAAIHQI
jgi:hypothetical protein